MVYYPIPPTIPSVRQSLISVYFQALIYYDRLFSFLALILQYPIFIYKYNLLIYSSSTIAGELIILTILLFLNSWRMSLGEAGNKGKRFGWICGFLGLTALIIIGWIYVVALQTNALYL